MESGAAYSEQHPIFGVYLALGAMTRKILAIWIFLSSVAASLVSASLVSLVMRANGSGHLHSSGQKVTMASESFSAWLPYAPSILFASTTASIIALIYFSRSSKAADLKSFAICLIASFNYFCAFFVLMSLVSAHLLANGT
jgi:hypothetical protein